MLIITVYYLFVALTKVGVFSNLLSKWCDTCWQTSGIFIRMKCLWSSSINHNVQVVVVQGIRVEGIYLYYQTLIR